MSWEKSDYSRTKKKDGTAPPTPERTPRKQRAHNYKVMDDDLPELQEFDALELIGSGLISDREWDKVRQLMTRGIGMEEL